MSLTIHAISDTHNQHNSIPMPGGDIVIHSGDSTSGGTLPEIIKFLGWYSKLNYSHKILIAGNHDWGMELNPSLYAEECSKRGITYLNDSSTEINGIKVFGSPVQPWFHDWAFNRFRGEDIKKHWDLIPNDTEILITHGPPYSILDTTAAGLDVGCADLAIKIKETKVKLHIFGHIHEGKGSMEKGGILYVNASSLNARYSLAKPYVTKIVRDSFGLYSIES